MGVGACPDRGDGNLAPMDIPFNLPIEGPFVKPWILSYLLD